MSYDYNYTQLSTWTYVELYQGNPAMAGVPPPFAGLPMPMVPPTWSWDKWIAAGGDPAQAPHDISSDPGFSPIAPPVVPPPDTPPPDQPPADWPLPTVVHEPLFNLGIANPGDQQHAGANVHLGASEQGFFEWCPPTMVACAPVPPEAKNISTSRNSATLGTGQGEWEECFSLEPGDFEWYKQFGHGVAGIASDLEGYTFYTENVYSLVPDGAVLHFNIRFIHGSSGCTATYH